MEGYSQAAEKFSKEANLQPMQEDPIVKDRQRIKQLIHEGNIQEAIEELNDLDPEVRGTTPAFSAPLSPAL